MKIRFSIADKPPVRVHDGPARVASVETDTQAILPVRLRFALTDSEHDPAIVVEFDTLDELDTLAAALRAGARLARARFDARQEVRRAQR